MAIRMNPLKWFAAKPVQLIKPETVIVPLPEQVTGKEGTVQAVECAMSTTAVGMGVVEQAAPAKQNGFVGWLKKAGAGFGRVLGIAIHEAQVAEPVVDLALIAAQQQGVAILYNKAVGLAVVAQASYGADPKHNAAKAADVVAKLGPEVATFFGGDTARAKTYVDSVVAGLGVLDAVTPEALAAMQPTQ